MKQALNGPVNIALIPKNVIVISLSLLSHIERLETVFGQLQDVENYIMQAFKNWSMFSRLLGLH